ncbi:hypothetical protein BP6252_05280 [Coleophoma cylindrospora]|uniref:Uncharacterized protein n=1 Tax=Coleophoma cylindrospora TaxID=1849047 RepID=A0A3D8RT12_9HELO|nr:hypothetical protein BP6252_05280 [Coleophoma cylindrospora]
MASWIKNCWTTLTTGWVVEYPGPYETPPDFFDGKDRRRQFKNIRSSAPSSGRSSSEDSMWKAKAGDAESH